ncbi:MAG: hypothetical protein ACRDL8_11750, partial [Solirubrobacteraceae bacterium]
MSRVTIALAAVVAAAVTAAPAAAGAQDSGRHGARAHATRHRVVIHKCVSGTAVAPKTYVLACGDGYTGLQQLHWKRWGSRTATATGRGFVNTCTPNCAAGRPATYPVVVTVSRLSNGAYSHLVVKATGRRPKGVAKTA